MKKFGTFAIASLVVSIPKRVSEALKLQVLQPPTFTLEVSIPKRVSEALKLPYNLEGLVL